MLTGFQEVSSNSFMYPGFAFRLKKDNPVAIRKMISVGEGKDFTDGECWGDYEGSIIDGDNLPDL